MAAKTLSTPKKKRASRLVMMNTITAVIHVSRPARQTTLAACVRSFPGNAPGVCLHLGWGRPNHLASLGPHLAGELPGGRLGHGSAIPLRDRKARPAGTPAGPRSSGDVARVRDRFKREPPRS